MIAVDRRFAGVSVNTLAAIDRRVAAGMRQDVAAADFGLTRAKVRVALRMWREERRRLWELEQLRRRYR